MRPAFKDQWRHFAEHSAKDEFQVVAALVVGRPLRGSPDGPLSHVCALADVEALRFPQGGDVAVRTG